LRFVTRDEVAAYFSGQTVAVVGSAPSCLDNAMGFIDGHGIVVRVNNHKLRGYEDRVGWRTDCHYSFYGSSIKKTAEELQAEGVELCLCKCPDAKFMDSPWHHQRGKDNGVDFRYIYRNRQSWWFCDTYVPTLERFLESFHALENHVPSTGFACLYELLALNNCEVYATGFDFFSSGKHNVDERWRAGDPSDPIGHRPDLELRWLKRYYQTHDNLTVDRKLLDLMT
jgi:hypothetical protein